MRSIILTAVTAAFLAMAGTGGAMPNPSSDSATPTAAAPAPLPSIVRIVTPPATSVVDQLPGGNGGSSGSTRPATSYPSGCRSVDFYAEQKSFIFHSRIYRFHQVKHWCWRGGIVYDVNSAWSFDGSSTACLGTVYPPNSWFFTWWNGKANSGHFSEQRAHVTNCVFHIGEWKEFYPDVKIWAYADGTYKVSTAN